MTATTNNAFEIEQFDDNPPEYLSNKIKTDFQYEIDDPQSKIASIWQKYRELTIKCVIFMIHVLVGAYFGYATYFHIDFENTQCTYYNTTLPAEGEIQIDPCGWKFCSGYGMLMLLIIVTYFSLFYYFVFKPKVGRFIHKQYLSPFDNWWMKFSRKRVISILSICVILIAFGIFVYFETRDNTQKLQSLVAPFLFILFGYIFSTKRELIKWRTVITGITCQFLLGVICIRWEFGRKVFQCLGEKVATFLAFTDEGSSFVYGYELVHQNIFAFYVLPVIIFFAFIISILYYLGAMQWIVMKLGWLLQEILGTTVCESVIAAANIFLGMSESPLLIKPYIKLLTKSEIHSLMVSGFATVSGSVLAAYLAFGASPAHLITSSVMAAPAALAFSKLYCPETEKSKTTSGNIELEKSEDLSVLDAAANGAMSAIPIVLGITANIISFVAFIAFLNGIVGWLGMLVGLENIDFEWIFSKLFYPLAWAMGIRTRDCNIVASVVARKTIINEFVAYERLGEYIKNDEISKRSAGIATFAICGFANPSSIGILIGALSTMAPTNRQKITAVAFRALVVGSIVCFVSASFAGLLINEED